MICKCKELERRIAAIERQMDSEQDRLTCLTESFESSVYTTSVNFLDVHSDMGWAFRGLWVILGIAILGLLL